MLRRFRDLYSAHMNVAKLVLAVLIAFSASHAAAPAVIGAPIDNIPGVPITSTSVASTVGGDFYDHVYALNVEAGTVLLVTLRGELGAELGLYLFDEDATSVYESEPFASSARPGSDQSVSTQFFGETTVYINVNGRNEDRPYEYQLNVSAVVDRTPPVIRVAEADARVRPSAACALVDAVDGISGVQSVAILSSRDASNGDWKPYTGRKRYCGALALEDGPHDLIVATRNRIGLISYKNAGATMFDRVPPTLVSTQPNGSVFYSAQPIASWRFSEPIRSTASGSARVFAVAQSGAVLEGRSWLDADRRRLYWQPLAPLAIGTMLSAVPAGVVDRAGNELSLIEPIVMTRKLRTSLSVDVTNVGAKQLALSISASSNLVGRSVRLSQRIGGSWLVVREVNLTGRLTRVLVPRSEATRYEVVWSGNDRLDASRDAVRGRPLSAS